MAAYPTLYTGTDGQPGAGYGEMWTTEDLGHRCSDQLSYGLNVRKSALWGTFPLQKTPFDICGLHSGLHKLQG